MNLISLHLIFSKNARTNKFIVETFDNEDQVIKTINTFMLMYLYVICLVHGYVLMYFWLKFVCLCAGHQLSYFSLANAYMNTYVDCR